jgi:Domain of unknown function (DUF4253)
MRGSRHGS